MDLEDGNLHSSPKRTNDNKNDIQQIWKKKTSLWADTHLTGLSISLFEDLYVWYIATENERTWMQNERNMKGNECKMKGN